MSDCEKIPTEFLITGYPLTATHEMCGGETYWAWYGCCLAVIKTAVLTVGNPRLKALDYLVWQGLALRTLVGTRFSYHLRIAAFPIEAGLNYSMPSDDGLDCWAQIYSAPGTGAGFNMPELQGSEAPHIIMVISGVQQMEPSPRRVLREDLYG